MNYSWRFLEISAGGKLAILCPSRGNLSRDIIGSYRFQASICVIPGSKYYEASDNNGEQNGMQQHTRVLHLYHAT